MYMFFLAVFVFTSGLVAVALGFMFTENYGAHVSLLVQIIVGAITMLFSTVLFKRAITNRQKLKK